MGIPGLYEKLSHARLYVLLSNISSKHSVLETARFVLDGGADIIQLREKLLPDKDFISIAEDLLRLTSKTEAALIINDRVHIAKLVNAAGAHIGQNDMKIDKARYILGAKKIIGVSTHSLKQAIEAEKDGADYIAIGPIFPTGTKDYEPVIGAEIASEVLINVKIPIFAIGGINLSNIGQVLKTGISKISVSSAIINSKDAAVSTKKFRDILFSLA